MFTTYQHTYYSAAYKYRYLKLISVKKPGSGSETIGSAQAKTVAVSWNRCKQATRIKDKSTKLGQKHFDELHHN